LLDAAYGFCLTTTVTWHWLRQKIKKKQRTAVCHVNIDKRKRVIFFTKCEWKSYLVLWRYWWRRCKISGLCHLLFETYM